jgi:hypothetical protein
MNLGLPAGEHPLFETRAVLLNRFYSSTCSAGPFDWIFPGRLTLTDDFLRATLLRPELAPIPESCAAELALHEKLIATPRATVAPAEVTPIADDDARANYDVWLRFRARLLAAIPSRLALSHGVVRFSIVYGLDPMSVVNSASFSPLSSSTQAITP